MIHSWDLGVWKTGCVPDTQACSASCQRPETVSVACRSGTESWDHPITTHPREAGHYSPVPLG